MKNGIKALEWKLYQSIAFPRSNSFWRCICQECGWMSIPHDKKPKENLGCPQCQIPVGPYCYEITKVESKTSEIHTCACPFWEKREDKSSQENGYCNFLKQGDWESPHLSLLWDMVKECGINNQLPRG